MSSAADRLRRLRWLLTALFTVMNAVAVIVLAVLLIQADADDGRQRLDAELTRVTTAVLRALGFVEDNLMNERVLNDPLNTRCPQFAVVPADESTFERYDSSRTCVEVPPELLTDIARQAVNSDGMQVGYATTPQDRTVRFAAERFRAEVDGPYVGAVVSVADAEPEAARHDRVVLLIIGGCVLLIGVVGIAGYLLAGRAIRPAAAALEQQETLLAETAHDLRTPVAALRALAETAERNPEKREELLSRTVRLAGRMGGIIDGLLVRARLAAGVEQLAIQPVWLDQLVTSVVEETPADGAQLTVTAAPSMVNGDPVLLQRAVANLLDNALRYGRLPGQQAIVHVAVANGRVTIADSGPGIDAAVAQSAFDRFATSGGSGLGLSIVRWVALAHGGTLSVYNAEEGGAIFELALPPVTR
ncbi:sensor histidine kinase [Thermocrispum municipale]|jgi:signal transduction histidine kinase|uniref:sensor histidine kinase n=1 Tax=Thermocrispum municipale TaxID=37926 RepID=UPI000414C745|nr:HAMP domain-containing sensor histidine kinase [Thermocrispum municipale]